MGAGDAARGERGPDGDGGVTKAAGVVGPAREAAGIQARNRSAAKAAVRNDHGRLSGWARETVEPAGTAGRGTPRSRYVVRAHGVPTIPPRADRRVVGEAGAVLGHEAQGRLHVEAGPALRRSGQGQPGPQAVGDGLQLRLAALADLLGDCCARHADDLVDHHLRRLREARPASRRQRDAEHRGIDDIRRDGAEGARWRGCGLNRSDCTTRAGRGLPVWAPFAATITIAPRFIAIPRRRRRVRRSRGRRARRRAR